MEVLNNPTFLDRTNLVGEWLLDSDAVDTSGNGNDGTASNITWVAASQGYVNETASYNGTSSEIDFGAVGNVKSISFWINLDSTTENIFEKSAGSGVSVSSGTLSYANWDNAFVDTVDTDTISTGWTHVVLTSTTDVNLSAFQFGVISTTYGSFDAGLIRVYSTELTESEIKSHYLEGLRKLGPKLLQSYEYTSSGLISDYGSEITSSTWFDIEGGNDCTNTDVGIVQSGRVLVGDFDGSTSISKFTGTYGFQTSQAFTISCWMKTSTSQDNSDWLFNGYGESNMGLLFDAGNKIQLFVQDSGPTNKFATSNNTVNDGEWHHIVGTYDGTTIKLYVDNVLQTDTETVSSMQSRAEDSSWGARNTGSQYYTGLLALPRVWDNDIGTTEIENVYNEGRARLFFPKYSLPSLENGKVLEISRAAVSGTYYDQSGNGNDSSSVTSVTDTTVGLNNKMTFNGTTSKIVCNTLTTSDLDVNDAWTVIARFKSESSGSRTLFVGGDGGSTAVDVYIKLYQWGTGDVLSAILPVGASSSVRVSTTTVVDDSVIHTAALTYDGSTVSIYLDGVLEDSASASISSGGDAETSSIGTDEISGVHFWDGDIYEVKVYTRGLSANEVKQDFYSNFIT